MTTDEEILNKPCASGPGKDSQDSKNSLSSDIVSSSEVTGTSGDNTEPAAGSSTIAACSDSPPTDSSRPSETLEFKLIYNKEKRDLKFPANETVLSLKKHIETLTGVPWAMIKLVYKGIAKDDKTLKEWGVVDGAKVMMVGSTLTDVLAIAAPIASKSSSSSNEETTSKKEPLSQQKMHKKIIDRGVPPEAMPAWRNGKSNLPAEPLQGMLNKSGGKVRLTFKLEADQLWIGTKERTEKVGMQSVKAIVSEPIEGHEEYHIMGIQLGPTEASRYWIYWVPAQYLDAIKETVLGS